LSKTQFFIRKIWQFFSKYFISLSLIDQSCDQFGRISACDKMTDRPIILF
ncbi:hypothetical protein M153_39050001592, partial [Pseudoloma neurophilia]